MSNPRTTRFLGLTDPFDVDHALVTSPVLSSTALALIRLALAVFTLVVILIRFIWAGVTVLSGGPASDKAGGQFSFFTQQSYIGLTAYFFAAGVQTVAYSLRGSKHYPLQRWPRILQFMHVLLYSTITTFPFLVTAVYWALLSGPTSFDSTFHSFFNVSEHILNAFFALFEITMTNGNPHPWIHLAYLELMLAGYVGVAYITHAAQGFYTYEILDPQKQGAKLAAYIVGIAVAEAIIFVIVRYACVLRVRLSTRSHKGGRPVPSGSSPGLIDDDVSEKNSKEEP